MDNTFINIFNGVLDQDTSKKISVTDIIWKISEGEWKSNIESYREESDKKKKEEKKKTLPAVTFAGTLNGQARLDKNLQDYTGIVVCDIDKIPPAKLNPYKNKLRSDGYVLAFFESPSKGLKVLIRVNSTLEYHKSHAFRQIEDYMASAHGIEIDPSGKNPSRLCFVSYDPDMYYEDDADVFSVDVSIDYQEAEKDATMRSVKQMMDNMEISNDSQYVFEKAIEWVKMSKTGSYHKGNRNNFIFALACILNKAGVHQDITLMNIAQRYPSLKFSEAKSTVSSAYRHNSAAFGTKPI